MSTAQIQYSVHELLQRAGATIRPHDRADCPKCGRRRAVSYTEEVYFCHGGTCDFNGNGFLLARELGLLKSLPFAEAQKQARLRARAREAAEVVAARIKEEVFALRVQHRRLLDIECTGKERLKGNSKDIVGRDMQKYSWRERLKVLAALTIIEDSKIPTRIKFVDANELKRKEMVESVISTQGIYDANDRFIEVTV